MRTRCHDERVRGDSTSHSTVLVCSCGARIVAATREPAYTELLAHQRAAGCDARATTAALRQQQARA